jgi:hypothetical protein
VGVLNLSAITRIRRNHALEHATIHVLSQRHRTLRLVGRSTLSGFFLYGQVDTASVASAASDALIRLQHGEKELAVHPRCGTNIAVAGMMAGLSTFGVMSGRSRSKLERLPQVILAATLAILLAQPLGEVVQSKITTTSNVNGSFIAGITRQQRAGMTVHHVRVAEE